MFAGGPHIARYAEEFGSECLPPRGEGDFLYHLRGRRIPIRDGAPAEPWPVELGP